MLLELYLENERRSGGGALEGLRSLPRKLGIVVSFQQWQVAERVLLRDHWLQDSKLSLVPHYEVLEPEELVEDASGGDHPDTLGPGATKNALLEAEGLAETHRSTETVTVGSGEAPEQLGASLTGPVGSPDQEEPIIPGISPEEATVSPEQARLSSQEPIGSAGPVGPVGSFSELPGQVGSPGSVGQEGLVEAAISSPGEEGLVGSMGIAVESPEKVKLESPGDVELLGQEDLVEMVLPTEPGAMRFLQLYHEDLLASLGDIALFPLEGTDTTGFRLCGALAQCQAAMELLQSLLGSISCHVLSLGHPGSARFLLGSEGQHLLQELEARFQCVFGTERLEGAILDMDPEEVDPTEALQVFPGDSHTSWPPDSTGSDQEDVNMEEIQKLLATLEGLDGESWHPLEPREERPEEQSEEEDTPGQEEEKPTPGAEEDPVTPITGAPGRLNEEAELQLALHRSLALQGQVAEQEAVALRQALALSLLEQPLLESEELLDGGTSGKAQLVVHAPFEQNMDELEQALVAALEVHLKEETVRLQGRVLPTELCTRLEQCYGVNIVLRGDCPIIRGFGIQPARAAHHLSALFAGPWDQSLASPLVTSDTTVPEQKLQGPLGSLEGLAENTREFQEVVQAFYSTLDAVHSRIRIIRVERVSHPLLQQQYQLHLQRLMQRCTQRPVERVLYHGTSASAVPDICEHGFNRSFCGRNGTLYGRGVYFAKRASLSVLDRYSPPDADGHKAVFVARVLTGDYGQGRSGLRVPPLRAPGHVLRYDSAVDRLHEPNIFVIFHDTQALPTHLITCERILHASPGGPPELLDSSPAT
ncbi:protein mono-ADP-ribosyltransferase PARP10 isoform X2 [Castor canadensis]